AAGRGPLLRHRLCGALDEGAAHPRAEACEGDRAPDSRGVDAEAARRARPQRRDRPGAAVTWRDTTCGALRAADAGRRVTLAGWADTRRDHGGLVFVDLRDYTGKVQLVVNPEHAVAAAAVAHDVRNEFVLQAEGEVVPRAPEAINPNIPTGEIEVQVDTLR